MLRNLCASRESPPQRRGDISLLTTAILLLFNLFILSLASSSDSAAQSTTALKLELKTTPADVTFSGVGVCQWTDTQTQFTWIYGGSIIQSDASPNIHPSSLWFWDPNIHEWQLLTVSDANAESEVARLFPHSDANASCWFDHEDRVLYSYDTTSIWGFSHLKSTWTEIWRSVPATHVAGLVPTTKPHFSWFDTTAKRIYLISSSEKINFSNNQIAQNELWVLDLKRPKQQWSRFNIHHDDSLGLDSGKCRFGFSAVDRLVKVDCVDSSEWILNMEPSLSNLKWIQVSSAKRRNTEQLPAPQTTSNSGPGEPPRTEILSIGAIVGISVASVLSVLLAVVIAVVCYRDQTESRHSRTGASRAGSFSASSSKSGGSRGAYYSDHKLSVYDSKRSENMSKPSATTSFASSAESDSVESTSSFIESSYISEMTKDSSLPKHFRKSGISVNTNASKDESSMSMSDSV